MNAYVTLSRQTAGKDKITRLIQYASKLIAYLLGRMKVGVEVADQLNHLEFQFATFRKLLRLGKSLEVLHGTLKTLHIPDLVLRLLLTLSRIAQGLFLAVDHIMLIGRIGLLKINYEKWNQLYNRCWLYSVTLNLLRDVYEIRLFLKSNHGRIPKSWLPQEKNSKELSNTLYTNSKITFTVQSLLRRLSLLLFSSTSFCIENKHIAIDSIKNMCDILIPLSNLGSLRLNPGVVGVLGILSSIAGIAVLLDPTSELIPS